LGGNLTCLLLNRIFVEVVVIKCPNNLLGLPRMSWTWFKSI
jgi:hypothetical protein